MEERRRHLLASTSFDEKVVVSDSGAAGAGCVYRGTAKLTTTCLVALEDLSGS